MRIVIIGAGNVATHLATAFSKKDHTIAQIYSRTTTTALKLAKKIGCNYTTKPDKIIRNADLYVISVSDKAISTIIESIKVNEKLIVHTAGSISIEVFKKKFRNYGVLYPLQTFSKFKSVDFKSIPFCIEANSEKNLSKLKKLAADLSENVYSVDSKQRKSLHLAAVFACNFVNHFYAISEEIIKENNLPINIIKPLIEETAQKVKDHSAKISQTGPAIRNDKEVIKDHLELLNNHTQWKKLYSFVSNSIFDYHNSAK